jgi:hypothetical protein
MHSKFTQLALVTVVPRFFIGAVYLAVSCYLIYSIVYQSSVPVATRLLHVNERIGPDDLQTSETAKLIGKYLYRDVAPGRPITPDIVGPQKLPPKIAFASVAVIVRISSAELLNRGIQEGSSVVVIMKSDTVSGKVEKIDCSAQPCSVFVGLTGRDPQSIDPQAWAAADIEPTTAIVP